MRFFMWTHKDIAVQIYKDSLCTDHDMSEVLLLCLSAYVKSDNATRCFCLKVNMCCYHIVCGGLRSGLLVETLLVYQNCLHKKQNILQVQQITKTKL